MTLSSNVKALKNFAITVGIILFLITSCNVWISLSIQNYYMGLLPEKIEVSSINYASGGCYFAIFNLSDKTVNEINQQGISFFKDATKARAHGGTNLYYYQYQEWQRTPIQYSDENKNFHYGIECVKGEFDIDPNSIGLARISAEGNHSFYTGHSQGQLVVVPSLKIAVISGLGH